MAATAAQVAQLRRWTNEPDEDTYTDEALETLIESFPLMDERGEAPYAWDTSTSPPTQDENDDWISTYDLAAAAAEVWDEKAGVVEQDFDFSADGGRYDRSQVAKGYGNRARYYRARRAPRTRRMFVSPEAGADRGWIANLAEEG